MTAPSLEARIDALVESGERRGRLVALAGVAETMRVAAAAGKDPLGVVEAVALHVQAQLQMLGSELEGGRHG